MIKLGLLGNNISKSEMPNLITKLGNEFGFEIKYKLFDQALKTNRLELIQMLCKTFDNYVNFSLIDSR